MGELWSEIALIHIYHYNINNTVVSQTVWYQVDLALYASIQLFLVYLLENSGCLMLAGQKGPMCRALHAYIINC